MSARSYSSGLGGLSRELEVLRGTALTLVSLCCAGRWGTPFHSGDSITFKAVLIKLQSAHKLPGDFAKTQALIPILGDSDAGSTEITLEIVASEATLSNMVAAHHMSLLSP